MKIIVLGKEGLVGRYVYKYLKNNFNNVYGTTRTDLDYLDTENLTNNLLKLYEISEQDIVINCVGILKHIVNLHKEEEVIKVNALAPLLLAELSRTVKFKFINITSDCVYSGLKSFHTENDFIDHDEIYALTKRLGEHPYAINIRTSVCGEEIKHKRSFLEWVLSSEGKEIDGFVNHFWNGITCLELAKVIEKMIKKNIWWHGTRHIFSPESFNKYELSNMFAKLYNINPKSINKYSTEKKVDRTLSTVYNENERLEVQSFFVQMKEMYDFSNILRAVDKE